MFRVYVKDRRFSQGYNVRYFNVSVVTDEIVSLVQKRKNVSYVLLPNYETLNRKDFLEKYGKGERQNV